ncbi:MAG TPA: DUF4785 domain-containing protein [Thermoanaerobaculia bacterium]|nr:DUF4785 domain-containing protein [Thermoanaerobaculia bacterium]
MRTSTFAASLALTTALALPAVSGAQLLASRSGDLVPSRLVAPPAGPSLNDSRDAVSFAWPLPAGQSIAGGIPAVSAASREYWLRLSAEELVRGVALPTTAARALVRIHPAAGARQGASGPAVDPATVVLTDRTGRSFGSGQGMELLVGEAELAQAGVPFPAGTTAFRLSAEVGSGLLRLAVPDLAADPAAPYLVHVFEPESSVELTVSLPRGLYLHGESLGLELTASAAGKALPLASATAFVTSPSGRAWSLPLSTSQGRMRGVLRLDAREPAQGGLWEVHVVGDGTAGEAKFLRNARAAFAVALPSARLTGGVKVARDAAGLSLRLDVETAAAGRFEVRGVLYGRDARGEARPLAQAHAAAWLDKGPGSLTLVVPAELLAGSALTAPFELRHLELIDQGRMGVLHRQDLALSALTP